MKFVDEALVKVVAGHGGVAQSRFRREKFVPFGGPDGGDGGLGGSVWLRAQEGMNKLVDYRIRRTFRAQNGQPCGGQDCTGRGGDDLYVPVPVGTVGFDDETGETLGDLSRAGQTLLVARGGKGGWGNQRFKTSVKPHAAPERAGSARRSAKPAGRTAPACGRGAAGPAQCRKIHADPRGFRGASPVGSTP